MINFRPVKSSPALPRLSTGIVSFFVPRTIVSQSLKHHQAESVAIDGDWKKVGDDLHQAMRMYEAKYLKSNQ